VTADEGALLREKLLRHRQTFFPEELMDKLIHRSFDPNDFNLTENLDQIGQRYGISVEETQWVAKLLSLDNSNLSTL
jgi:hypothetical protein